MKEKPENNQEFQNIIKDIIQNPTVQEMKKYRQHFDTSCFDHCYIASYYCYLISKRLNLDYISCARAAMLHDLFLYDWRQKNGRKGFHAYTHGKTALQNAEKLFQLNEKEKDIIKKHMWPVTISLPKSKEAFLLTFVDKYCAIEESLQAITQENNFQNIFKKIPKYAYLFLNIILFKKTF